MKQATYFALGRARSKLRCVGIGGDDATLVRDALKEIEAAMDEGCDIGHGARDWPYPIHDKLEPPP